MRPTIGDRRMRSPRSSPSREHAERWPELRRLGTEGDGSPPRFPSCAVGPTAWRAGSAGPDDRLHLRVRVQPERPAVTADARLLEAAERGLVVALQRVDADVARPQPLGDVPRPAGVLREHVAVEPEV